MRQKFLWPLQKFTLATVEDSIELQEGLRDTWNTSADDLFRVLENHRALLRT